MAVAAFSITRCAQYTHNTVSRRLVMFKKDKVFFLGFFFISFNAPELCNLGRIDIYFLQHSSVSFFLLGYDVATTTWWPDSR